MWARKSATRKWRCPEGTVYVTVVEDDGKPCKMFVVVGKGGSELYADGDAVARCIRLGLEAGVGVERFVKELKGITHEKSNTLAKDHALSMADAVARTLEELYLSPRC